VVVPGLRPGGRLTFFSPGTSIEPARVAVLDALFAEWTVTPYRLPQDEVPVAWTLGTIEFCVPVAVKG